MTRASSPVPDLWPHCILLDDDQDGDIDMIDVHDWLHETWDY